MKNNIDQIDTANETILNYTKKSTGSCKIDSSKTTIVDKGNAW